METESAYNEWLTGFSRLIYSEKAVTQVALAQRVNVDKGYINSILKGRKNAGFHLQEAISRALGMSHDDVRNVGREVLGLPRLVVATGNYVLPAMQIRGKAQVVSGSGNNVVQQNAAPVVSSPGPGGGEIERDLCERIVRRMANQTTEEKIAFHTRMKKCIEEDEGGGE